MSKLWIIHRNSRRREALVHLSGLAEPDLVCGAPTDSAFSSASAPAAVLLGVVGDFELELDFLHRHREALARSRRFFLTTPEDALEVQRLFGATTNEILDTVPTDRSLRALVLSAASHRNAESLTQRRERDRIARRFSHWFGDTEIPGVLRALDPTLGRLPLLVRGVPGSGRTLLARYAELFRGAPAPSLQIDGRELNDINDIANRLASRRAAGLQNPRTVWIDDVDACPAAVQRSLAEWIRLDAGPQDGAMGGPLRWVATARPRGFHETLEASLERVFAPLDLTIPAIVDDTTALAAFAEQVAGDWAESLGGVPRRISESVLVALEAHAWSGDRAAVEAVLRTSFAATGQNPLRALATYPLAMDSDDSVSNELDERPRPIVEANAIFDEARFLDEVPEQEAFEPGDLEPPSPIEDFERAFTEGLPARDSRLGQAPRPAANASPDPSTQFSDESFEVVRTGTDEPTRTTNSERRSDSWRRLARSLSHEIRNPLVSIRTFTELLPEHFEDPSFRERFTELVGRDVAHINDVVSRLADAAASEKLEAAPVDVSALLERILEARRERIGKGRLLVLRELERDSPLAWADPHALEVALSGLLDRALAALPERGDLFVATRRIERSADGTPRLRILLRHHSPDLGGSDQSGLEELSSAANVLEYVLAETVVEASGGSMTIDSTDAQETLILVDLRTPS